jgi:ATP-binding cassette, subfamily B, bacterial
MIDQLKMLFWVLRLQYQGAKRFVLWRASYSLFQGLSPIVLAYLIAQLLAEVAQIAIGDGSPDRVYGLLVGLFIIRLIEGIATELNSLLGTKHNLRIQLENNRVYYEKLYDLSQEQFEDEEFNTKLSRAQEGLFGLSGVSNEIEWMASSLIRLVSSSAALVIIEPVVGVVVILAVIPAAFLSIRQNQYMEQAYRDSDHYNRVAYRSRWILINPQAMVEVRLANAFKGLAKSWRENMQKTHDIEYAAGKRSFLSRVYAVPIEPIVEFGANVLFFRQLAAGVIGSIGSSF